MPGFSTAQHDGWLALNAYETATGEQKNAVGNSQCVKSANFVWFNPDLKPLPPSPATTASTAIGGKPQFFRFDSSNELNFAFRWREYERANPCPTEAHGF